MTDDPTKKGIEEQISDALEIDETKIEDELLRQPSLFFYWSMGWALAARKRRLQKLSLRKLEAELTQQFRTEMLKENPGLRLTEKMINDYLAEHPAFYAAQQELIKAEYTEDMLNVASLALKQKHQALLELHKNQQETSISEYNTVKAFKDEIKEQERRRSRRKKVESTEDVDQNDLSNKED